MMSSTAPAITIRSGGWQRTFAAGHEHRRRTRSPRQRSHPPPRKSRSHVILRHLDGGWVAVDDNSSNGILRRRSTRAVRRSPRPADHPPRRPRRSPADIRTRDRAARGRQPETSRDSITIGRSADNDIVVPDVLASLHHAKLVTTEAGVQLQNTGSGTFVNGVSVTQTRHSAKTTS